MLELVRTESDPRRLDRAKWHAPLISIVVTHHNYSDHIGDALLSLLDQTHGNWECVVVDDASDDRHRQALKKIVADLREESPKIRVIWLEQNVGQIPAFFAGLEATTGEFVCPLDPDDRYSQTFLEEALAAHHHPALFCPVVCTDQFILKNGEVITATTAKRGSLVGGDVLSFAPAGKPGWHWSSTSGLMLRRTALKYLVPHKPIVTRRGIEMRALDAYIAPGAHRLGGTIFVKKPLVYRGVHANNSFISADLCTSFQNTAREGAIGVTDELAAYLTECLEINGAPTVRRRRLLAKWRRSIGKRWRAVRGKR